MNTKSTSVFAADVDSLEVRCDLKARVRLLFESLSREGKEILVQEMVAQLSPEQKGAVGGILADSTIS